MSDNINQTEYKVLARKYRPKLFKELIGQEVLVETLSKAILNNQIAHAYLLTGVRGVGKTSTARLIAKAVNCEQSKNNSYEPCGNCETCISIGKENNLDVIEMDAASKTGVDDIREIIDNIKYKPVKNKYKVFIIDEVHMLSNNAFNALLKTLEEPPPHIKFLFATTEVKKLPITIISRCQRFDLHRVENFKLTTHIKTVSSKENIKIDQDAISLIVRAADGSVRDSLSLLDQANVNSGGTINSKTVISMLGLADRGKIYDLVDSIFQGNAKLSLEIFQNIYSSGADVLMIFEEMLKITHFLTKIKIDPSIKDDVYIPELDRTVGFGIANKLKISTLSIVWQLLFKGYQELQTGNNLFQLGEMIIIRVIYLYNGPSPDDLLKKVEKEISNNNQITQTPIAKDDNSSKTINHLNSKSKLSNNNDINIKSFRHFVDLFYQKREAILHTQLYNSVKLISFKEGEVIINCERISNVKFPRNIAKLISKWTGRIWLVNTSSNNTGKTLQEEDIINEQKEIELMKNDPEIKLILETFSNSKIHSITNIAETKMEKSINKKEKMIKED